MKSVIFLRKRDWYGIKNFLFYEAVIILIPREGKARAIITPDEKNDNHAGIMIILIIIDWLRI